MWSKTAVSTLVLVFGTVTGLVTAPAAGAEAVCNTTFQGATIEGDLVVPAGADCQLLLGTVVHGSVVVRDGGALFVNRSSIEGNLGAEGGHLTLRIGRVSGNLTARHGSFAMLGGDIGGTVLLEGLLPTPNLVVSGLLTGHFTGDVILRGMSMSDKPFSISDSFFDRSLLVYGNQVPVEITFNRVGGVMACDGNVPPPTGHDNTAVLGKLGQCASV